MWGKVLIVVAAAVCAMGVVASAVSAEEASGVSGWAWFDRDENWSFDTADAPRTGFTVHEVATGVRIKVVSPGGMVGTQYRVPGSEWYFVGATGPFGGLVINAVGIRALPPTAGIVALLAAGLLVLVSRSVREPAVEDGGQDREVPELARG